MNKMSAWFKSIRWERLVTVFLASVCLFVTTACGGQKVAAKTADQIRDEVPESALTSPYQGGMNDYSDIDPRMDTTKTQQAKTKDLINRVEKNLQKENYENPPAVGKQLQRATGNIREAAEDRAESVAKGTQRGLENIKENTANAAEETGKFAQRNAENVKENAQQAARDAAKSVQRTGEDVSDLAKDKANQAAKSTQRALEDASDTLD